MTFKSLLSAALCSLALVSLSCNSNPSTGGGAATLPGASGSGGNSAGVVSASDKPLDVISKAMHAQLDAKSYRANINTSGANATTSTMLIEYAAPDRYHLSTQAQTGGRQFSMEYIIIGKDTYMKMNNGAWTKSPVDMSAMISAFRDPKVLDELTKDADVKFVGADTLGGAPMLVYEYTVNNFAGMKFKSDAKTWVAVADGLPRKTESAGEASGIKSKSVITFSDYNADIKIEPPTK
jgi:hypothetical protein